MVAAKLRIEGSFSPAVRARLAILAADRRHHLAGARARLVARHSALAKCVVA